MQFLTIIIALLPILGAIATPVALPAADPKRTYISYPALGRDAGGQSDGRSGQANPPSTSCTVGSCSQ